MAGARLAACRTVWAAVLATGLITFAAGQAGATTIFSENFDTLPVGPGSWVNVNNSAPPDQAWFQGNSGVFSAQQGAGSSYAAANFVSAGFGGNISNWLITPELALDNGQVFSFYTRTEPSAVPGDRLQVRLSGSGSSTDVGTTDASVGDFSTLLLDINPLETAGYPEDWTLYSLTLSGLSGPLSGRLAFRYIVTDTSLNGDYIGLDTVTLSDAVATTPLPASLPLFASGLGLLGVAALRRTRPAAI